MFTGIIDHCGEIVAVKHSSNTLQLRIKTQFMDLQLGESIAVDGACLTVIHFDHNVFSCDLSPDTLNVTIASHYQVGSKVNLERPLRLMDRIGGHFVTGHVEQTASLQMKSPQAEFIEMEFVGIAPVGKNFLIKKGSIAVNGISLTINEVTANGFKVMIIPHTWERTNLSSLEIGEKVNIEFDLLNKIVVNQLQLKEKIYA